MAAAVPLDDVEEALATCDICEEPFDADSRVPLTLIPCRHVFCRTCVTTLAEASPFPCPKCRANVDLGQEGVKGLSTDRVTMNAVDYISMKKRMQTTGISCTDCPDGAKAAFRCHTCRTHLCTKCHDAHARTTVTRSHQTVEFSTYMESMENFVKEKESCSKHPDKDIELYCKSCSISVCTLCGMVEHRSHDVAYFEEVYKQTIGENESLRGELSQRVHRVSELRKTQQEILELIKTSVSKVQQDIQNRIATSKSFLDDRQSELTQTCDDMLREVETSYKLALDRLTGHEERLQERKSALKQTQEMTRPTQFVNMQKELSQQVRTLLSLKDPPLYQPRDIHFHPVGCQAVSAAIKAMGTVARAGQPPVPSPLQVDLEQLLRLQGNQVTKSDLEDGSVAFVCVRNQDQVIYIAKPDAETKQINVRLVICAALNLSEEDLNSSEICMSNTNTLTNLPTRGSSYPSKHGLNNPNAYLGTSGTILFQGERGIYFECHLCARPTANSTDYVIAEVALGPVGISKMDGPVCEKQGRGIIFCHSKRHGGKLFVCGVSQGTSLYETPLSRIPMSVGCVTKAEVGLLLKNHVLFVFDVALHQLLLKMEVDDTHMKPWFGLFGVKNCQMELKVVSGNNLKLDVSKLRMLSSVL